MRPRAARVGHPPPRVGPTRVGGCVASAPWTLYDAWGSSAPVGRDCGRGRHVQWCFEILHHVRCEDCSCLSFQNLTSPFQPRLPAAPRAGPPRTANAIPGARPKPRIPPERGRLPLPFPHTFGPLRILSPCLHLPVLHTFTARARHHVRATDGSVVFSTPSTCDGAATAATAAVVLLVPRILDLSLRWLHRHTDGPRPAAHLSSAQANLWPAC